MEFAHKATYIRGDVTQKIAESTALFNFVTIIVQSSFDNLWRPRQRERPRGREREREGITV